MTELSRNLLFCFFFSHEIIHFILEKEKRINRFKYRMRNESDALYRRYNYAIFRRKKNDLHFFSKVIQMILSSFPKRTKHHAVDETDVPIAKEENWLRSDVRESHIHDEDFEIQFSNDEICAYA